MDYKIKCGNCNKIFIHQETSTTFNVHPYVIAYCTFCNINNRILKDSKKISKESKVVKENAESNLKTSLYCRKCRIDISDFIKAEKNLVKCFKCGAWNSRTPSSEIKSSENKEDNADNKKSSVSINENNLLDLDTHARELYVNSDGHIAGYEEWDYDYPDL